MLGKLVTEAAVVTMRDVETVLDQACALHLCKGAAAHPESVLSNLTTHLQGQIQFKRGSAFNIKCLGSVNKEGTACISCKYLRKALVTRQSRLKKRRGTSANTCGSAGRKLKVCTRRNKRLLLRIGSLEKDIQRLKNESAASTEEALAAKINSLPPKQQLAVRKCFEAAKRKSSCGMRYDNEWMLECIFAQDKEPKVVSVHEEAKHPCTSKRNNDTQIHCSLQNWLWLQSKDAERVEDQSSTS